MLKSSHPNSPAVPAVQDKEAAREAAKEEGGAKPKKDRGTRRPRGQGGEGEGHEAAAAAAGEDEAGEGAAAAPIGPALPPGVVLGAEGEEGARDEAAEATHPDAGAAVGAAAAREGGQQQQQGAAEGAAAAAAGPAGEAPPAKKQRVVLSYLEQDESFEDE